MKTALLFLLAAASTLSAAEKNASQVVQEFYDGYYKQLHGSPRKFVLNHVNLTKGFKTAYAALLKKAGPELDWDPILSGNDFPDTGYQVSQSVFNGEAAMVVLRPRDTSFDATIIVQMVKVDERWLINGINNLVGESLSAGY